MSKEVSTNIKKGDIVQIVTQKRNKHGELKGANKKETKNLRAACPHHIITKKGKIRPQIRNNGNGTVTCTMCDHTFPTTLPQKNEVRDKIKGVTELLDQARYIGIAADLGKDTISYLTEVSVELSHLGKTITKAAHVVERREQVGKKKKNKGDNSGSSSFGKWR